MVARAAALAVHSPSTTARTSVISIASLRVTGRTQALRLRWRMISPSYCSSARASRTAPREVSYFWESSLSTSRCPGVNSPW